MDAATQLRAKLSQFREDGATHDWERVGDTAVATSGTSGAERVACLRCGASGSRNWVLIDVPEPLEAIPFPFRHYDHAMTTAGKCSLMAVKAFRELRRQRRSTIRWGVEFAALCLVGIVWAYVVRGSWLLVWLFAMLGFLGAVITVQTIALQHARRDGWRRERDGERDAAVAP